MRGIYIKKFIWGFVLVSILGVTLFIPSPRNAQAQVNGIFGGLFDILDCAFDLLGIFGIAKPQDAYASVPVHETALAKEGCPDIAAWFLAKILLRQLVGDIIDWIKTGGYDRDRPLYVEDFRAYLVEAEDRGKGIFLNELNNQVADSIGAPFRDFVLGHFNSSVHTDDTLPYPFYDADIEDPQAFFNDFSKGGFLAHMQTILNPSNNPWGASRLLSDRLNAQETTEFKQTDLETVSSEGFLPDKGKCLQSEDFGAGPICIKFKKIKTPGSNVQDILNEAFETDFTTLEGADEISEIIAAFLSNLILGGILNLDTSKEGLNPVPEPPPDETATLTATPACSGTQANNILGWPTPTSGGTPVARFCTGFGCVVTPSSPIACSGISGCTHTNVLPSTSYKYRVFLGGVPYTNQVSVLSNSCEEGPPPPPPPPSF